MEGMEKRKDEVAKEGKGGERGRRKECKKDMREKVRQREGQMAGC